MEENEELVLYKPILNILKQFMRGRGGNPEQITPKGKLILFTDGVSVVVIIFFFPSNLYPGHIVCNKR